MVFGWYSAEVSVALPLTASAIENGKATSFGIGSNSVDGLVPDGVETVAVVLDNGTPMTATVSNNFFLIPAAKPRAGVHTLTTRWYAADGSLIKTASQTFRIVEELVATFKLILRRRHPGAP